MSGQGGTLIHVDTLFFHGYFVAKEVSWATAAYDMTDSIHARVARLESDVSHIRADISDLKIDLRQIREDLSAHRAETHHCFQALHARLASGQTEMSGEFKAVRSEMQDGFKAVRAEMHGEIKVLRTEAQTGFSELRTDISALGARMLKHEWAMLSLMVTLFLVLLGVMLRGFGWIG